jgi:dienelactone hydrolase
MTGNVREWTWNEFEGGRMAMGGAWSDPIYLYNQPLGVDPWNRSPANGVRLMQTMGSAQVATELRAPVSLGSPIDRRGAQPVPREQFELLAAAYEYPRDELDASIDSEDTSADAWISRVVSVRLSYTDERLRIAIFLPKDVDPPYQAVIFSPGIGPYGAGGGPLPGRPPRWVEHVLIDGRAVVVPEWAGAYGRREGNSILSSGQITAHLPRWREELGRTVDLLAQDPDFDPQRVGFWGESFGGSTFLPAVALEDRIKVWVLTDGALAALDLPPQADAVNFVSRVTVPVLMLNGELDELFPPVTNQIPLYDLLGTDPSRKARRTQRVAHGALLQERDWLVRASLAWFDQYLGRVE